MDERENKFLFFTVCFMALKQIRSMEKLSRSLFALNNDEKFSDEGLIWQVIFLP